MDDVWVWNPPLPLSTGHSQKKKSRWERDGWCLGLKAERADERWPVLKEQMSGDRCLESRWERENEEREDNRNYGRREKLWVD